MKGEGKEMTTDLDVQNKEGNFTRVLVCAMMINHSIYGLSCVIGCTS